MDGVSLLDRAAAAGLRIILVGDALAIRGPRSCASLVAEIRAHKAAVIAALAAPAEADPTAWAWETLSAQRWGEADPAPGIDAPREEHPPPPGFEPIAEEDAQAWMFDESLTIRTVDIEASIHHHRAQLAAGARVRPPGRGRPPSSPTEQARLTRANDEHPEPRGGQDR